MKIIIQIDDIDSDERENDPLTLSISDEDSPARTVVLTRYVIGARMFTGDSVPDMLRTVAQRWERNAVDIADATRWDRAARR